MKECLLGPLLVSLGVVALESRETEAPPPTETADMLHTVVQQHLQHCLKVVIYDEPFGNVAREASKYFAEFGVLVWRREDFHAADPSRASSALPPSVSGSLCVAAVVLASLQSYTLSFHSRAPSPYPLTDLSHQVTGQVVRALQREGWFPGAQKYVLAYTGSRTSMADIRNDRILGHTYNTILTSWWEFEESVIRHLDQEELSSDAASLAALPRRVYHLAATCPHCDSGRPVVRLVDVWIPSKLLWSRELYPDVFQNFEGYEMKVVTLEYAPFSCYNKAEDGRVLLKDCVDTRMLRGMAETFNFTYTVREPHDGQWGYLLKNGSYSGVIGAVQRYDADFSLNVAFTGDREKVIDYTVGYYNDPLTFCTTKPRPLNQALALIKPFQWRVWVAFIAMLVVAGPVYFLTNSTLQTDHDNGKKSKPHLSLTKCFLLTYGACLNQGYRWSSLSSARVFIGAWVLYSVVVTTMYVAMLTASLTLPTLSPTLNTLEELIQSDFSWGIQDLGAADYQLLKNSKVPLYQKVFQGLEMCPTLNECLQRARDTKYAFITWRLYMEDRIAIRFTSATGDRQLHVATGDFFPSEIGWATNPGCPYRQHFNRYIRRLLESGLITKWLDQIINDPSRRLSDDKDQGMSPAAAGPRALGLVHLQGVFLLLCLGFVISSGVLFVEVALTKSNGK
ncbi:putative glutamate receptor [Oratosquilla oratoria]|uniref:putative glutamate receptor n=1 Tax=Oratosquilla oratoria TaxID=337810 RepID=UPI003F75A4FD